MFDDKNWIKSSNIKNTEIPYLGRKMEEELNHWIGRYSIISGHDALEKAITLVGNYEFKRLHKEITGENSFKLLTKDNREIEIGFYYGDLDNPEKISIREGKIKDIYEVLYRNYADDLLVNRYKAVELDTGFEQHYYDKYYDYFIKLNGENKICVTIYNKNYIEQEYFLIDEEVKKEFKEKEFNNIMEVYDFFASKYPSFSIEINNKYRIQLEKIEVKNNNVREIKLIRGTNSNRYLIHEVFPEEVDQFVVEDLLNDVETIHLTQDEIKLRLK